MYAYMYKIIEMILSGFPTASGFTCEITWWVFSHPDFFCKAA